MFSEVRCENALLVRRRKCKSPRTTWKQPLVQAASLLVKDLPYNRATLGMMLIYTGAGTFLPICPYN